MKLTGIKLRNFRSIGAEGVDLTPWKKCNILVGKNNSGKSNALRAVENISQNINRNPTQGGATLGRKDTHRRDDKNVFSFDLQFDTDEGDTPQQQEWAPQTLPVDFSISYRQGAQGFDVSRIHFHKELSQRGSRELLNRTTPYSFPAMTPERTQAEIEKYAKNIFRGGGFAVAILPTRKIPEFRQIRDQQGSYSLDGTNLIKLLAQYQHPDEDNDTEKEKFDLIQRFVRDLLHLPNALLEVTHDGQTILLTNNGLRLPLSAYGTGVHELVILVTAVLSLENTICCIEEPEIHLHPTLQREFIGFIIKNTTNQYLISTHSPTLINAHTTMPPEARDQVQVFHLWLENGATVGGPVLEDQHSLIALSDLGVRASDILQSNCVIWVEGPSDRVYLNHWLTLAAPELIEGLHYSIMFYGGSLLSHLSVARDDVPEELVEILRVNQHAIVMMDDDRDNKHQRYRPTKKRVQAECEQSGGYCWITDGREVENYLPPSVVISACEEITGKTITISIDQYGKFEKVLYSALKQAGIKPFDYANNKVKYARIFVQHFHEEDIDGSPNLRKKLDDVIAKIKKWNE